MVKFLLALQKDLGYQILPAVPGTRARPNFQSGFLSARVYSPRATEAEDSSTLSLSALHRAASNGHASVVGLLLDVRAGAHARPRSAGKGFRLTCGRPGWIRHQLPFQVRDRVERGGDKAVGRGLPGLALGTSTAVVG